MSRSGSKRWLLVLALPLGLGLVGCGTSSTSGSTSVTDPLTFSNVSLPAGFVGEEYKGSTFVSGGVGPYAYRLAGGNLPAGLRFSGGNITGKPTETGTFRFRVEANDANLSNKVAEYTLNISALPPMSLKATLPSGEIRGETRIPITVEAPRNVRAARLIWELGEGVQVQNVVGADNGTLAMWKQEGKLLTVDLGFKSVPRTGARVALIALKPTQAVTLNSNAFYYETRDGKGTLLSEKKMPGAAASAESKATDAKSADAATETKPGETKPGEAKPGDTKTNLPAAGTTNSGGQK